MNSFEMAFGATLGLFVGAVLTVMILGMAYDARDENRVKTGFMATKNAVYRLEKVLP
ncbi:hypothetical protein EVB98_049 [Rhizobium phage RHph_N3_2]|nr:hypothetical protein EVB98_049 [Rhizobium phage RHph_N3_2]